MPSGCKLLITNWQGPANVGDAAILDGMIHVLRSADPEAEIVVVGNEPGLRIVDYPAACPIGISSPVPRPATDPVAYVTTMAWFLLALVSPRIGMLLHPRVRDFCRQILESDALLPKGGGYLYSMGGARAFLYALRISLPMIMAVRLGRPVIVLGHSVGPLHGMGGRVIRATLRRAAVIVVRDDRSLRLLAHFGIGALRAPDFALCLKPRAQGESAVDMGCRRQRVGVTAKDVQREVGVSLADLLDHLSAIVDRVSGGRATDVVGLVQVTGPEPSQNDLPVLQKLQNVIPDMSIVVPARSADAVREALRELDLLIATRLHSAILALLEGIPVVMLSYHPGKAEGIVEDLGLPESILVPVGSMAIPDFESAKSVSVGMRESIEAVAASARDVYQTALRIGLHKCN